MGALIHLLTLLEIKETQKQYPFAEKELGRKQSFVQIFVWPDISLYISTYKNEFK